ncbi:GNAT family N-acetyltransferase [Altererythrobacter sp. MF3-039]|uniref:GNAT family N-acetyltransferase n=1 Tax=Altererythrobacter sp. MF3-039 TaxID=3252901 RepID=UPI00390C8DC5
MPNHAPAIAAPLRNVETERLLLERFELRHAAMLAPIFAKHAVWEFPYGRGFSTEETEGFVETQTREWHEYGIGCWVASEKANGRTIGYAGLSIPHFLPDHLPAVEVGWRFDPDVWGRGYATEAASAALDEAFGTLELNRVCSAPQVANPPSFAVCERLGMTREGIVSAAGNEKRGPVDVYLYWITREAWEL